MCYIYFKDNLISKLIIKPKIVCWSSLYLPWDHNDIDNAFMSWTKGVGFLRSWRAPSSLFQKVAFRWMATLENNMVTKKNFLKMAIVLLIIWPNINRFFKFLLFQICWLLILDLYQNFSCQTYFLPAMATKMVATWSAELWYCISDRYYKIIWFNQQSF